MLDGKCVAVPIGKFVSGPMNTGYNDIMSSCSVTCERCRYTADNCTTCLTPNVLQPIDTITQKRTCLLTCSTACSGCTIAYNNCNMCSSPSLFMLPAFPKDCLPTCPAGYVGISGVCQPCSSECLTCQFTTTNCVTCDTTLSLKLSRVLSTLGRRPVRQVVRRSSLPQAMSAFHAMDLVRHATVHILLTV